ncbi:MAG: hypothetical protein HS122_13735 [Opitutaceae bacterium]|nr:hypothetical protein [Opitutaceae bacterium]
MIRLQAAMVARGAARPSDNTSAYCRLASPLISLGSVAVRISQPMVHPAPGDWLGRTVRIMDGPVLDA